MARQQLTLGLGEPFDPIRFNPPPPDQFKLGRFVVDQSNSLPFTAVNMAVSNPIVQFNPLIVFGEVSLGKTLLLNAAVNEFLKQHPEASVIRCTAEVFMWEFVRSIKRNIGAEFKTANYGSRLVVVDDVDFFNGKEETLKEFENLVAFCVENEVQVVVSMKESPSTTPWLPERLRSIFSGGLVTMIKASNTDLRHRIIQSHFGEQLGGCIGEDAVAYIAEQVTDHRALIGCVKTLQLASLHYPQIIGREQAEELLAYQIRVAPKKVTIAKIIDLVAAHYLIDIDELLARRRDRKLSHARQTAMFLARMLTEQPHAQIAEALNLNDHTTIIYGVREVEKRRKEDLRFREELRKLTLTLDPKWQNP